MKHSDRLQTKLLHEWGLTCLYWISETHHASLILHCNWQIHVFLQFPASSVFATRCKLTNRELVAFRLITSEDAFRLILLRPFLQVRYLSFDILFYILFSLLTLSSRYFASDVHQHTPMSKTWCVTADCIICLMTKLTNFMSDPSSFSAVLKGLALPHSVFLSCSFRCRVSMMLLWAGIHYVQHTFDFVS